MDTKNCIMESLECLGKIVHCCSNCSESYGYNKSLDKVGFKFCPNCGARISGWDDSKISKKGNDQKIKYVSLDQLREFCRVLKNLSVDGNMAKVIDEKSNITYACTCNQQELKSIMYQFHIQN